MDTRAIIEERHQIVERMVSCFRGRPGTRALFLSGSMASGQTDEHSDIDFRVVVEPACYERFLSERETAPAAWGELLFNQCRPGTNVCVSHFRPFVKVDVFYYRPDQLRPSPWYTLPVRILHDPEGLVQRVIEASARLEFIPDVEEVERSISFALAALHEGFRRAARGELLYAQEILNEVRQSLIDAEEYLHQRPPYGLSHFEQRSDPALVHALHASLCSLETQAICQSLAGLSELYRERVLQLHARFALQRDLQADLSSIEILRDLLAGVPAE